MILCAFGRLNDYRCYVYGFGSRTIELTAICRGILESLAPHIQHLPLTFIFGFSLKLINHACTGGVDGARTTQLHLRRLRGLPAAHFF